MSCAGHAAWSTWEHATDTLTNICCGLGGLAYALLARYRATGDASWYRRAAALAARAARVSAADPPPHPDSLYHGVVGIALLVADLGRPQTAGHAVLRQRRLVLGRASRRRREDWSRRIGPWALMSRSKRGLPWSGAKVGSIRIHPGER